MQRLVILSVLLLLSAATLAEAGGRDRAAAKRTPKEEALVALGRSLFFDPVVSRSGARSCASCHDPEHGFSDPDRVSDDDFGRTRRHSQTLIDSHINPSAHWDGEFESISRLVLARIGAIKGRKGKVGHGTSLLDAVTAELGDDPTEDLLTGDPETPVEEEEVIDEGDDGGNDDDDDVYAEPSGREEARPRAPSGSERAPTTPSARSAKEGSAPKAAGAAPGKQPDAPAKKPAADPKPAQQKKKDAAPDAMAAKRGLSLEERKRRAAALREKLRKLPLAEDRVEDAGRYADAFRAAFGNDKVNAQRIARAIEAYCHSLESTTAPFDRYQAGDEGALSASAKRGLALFRGKAACASCHTIEGTRPAFTDFAFHNTGVVWNRLSKKQRKQMATLDETFLRRRDDLERPKEDDEGRARISTRKADLRAFKTPTLRDVSRRGPYMHDGRFATLKDVVAYYARGGSKDPARASHVKPFEASEEEIADLVAFMESLTGDKRPGLPAAAPRTQAKRTRLRFVDADGKALAGLAVELRPVADRTHAQASTRTKPMVRRTDARGWLEFTNRLTIHTRIGLPGDLQPVGGAFVPDSCTEATVRVPVRGKAELVLHVPKGVDAPATLAADHVDAFVLPGHARPRTLLTRGEVLDLGRSRVVRYQGWLRTDVPGAVRVRMPGLPLGRAHATLSADKPARIDFQSK